MLNYNLVEFETAFGTVSQLDAGDIPEIVFAGKSNVGKSSLLNRLFNRKNFARVSSTPGKTITINFFRIEDVRFVDLPGYGFAKRPRGEMRRWADLMEHYFASERNIKLVVQLLDIRHKPTADDNDMLNYLIEHDLPLLVVLTKSEKLKPTERKKREEEIKIELENLGDTVIIPFSSENGEGCERLKEEIEKVLQ